MDLSQYNLKFGERTQWTVKYACQWCFKPLLNQSEQKFKLYGNICPECNAKHARNAIEQNTEREVTHTERLIKKTRMEMDLLALKLDEEISEKERLEIVSKMEQKFVKIKLLKS